MKKAVRDQLVQIRCTGSEKRAWEDRAAVLGADLSGLAREGLDGTPLQDLALVRTAIRVLPEGEMPIGVYAAWTRLTSSFAVVSDGAWPDIHDGRLLKQWAKWAVEALQENTKRGG